MNVLIAASSTLELAYLDPGSGSIILQAVLGGLAGGAVLVRLLGARIRRVLPFGKKSVADESDGRPDEENVKSAES